MKRFWHLNLYGRVLEGSEKRCFRSWRLWWEYEFGILVDWCRIMNLICSMIRSIAILCFLILIHTPIRRMKYGWGSHFDLTRSCLFCSLSSIRRARSIPPRENANPQSFRRNLLKINRSTRIARVRTPIYSRPESWLHSWTTLTRWCWSSSRLITNIDLLMRKLWEIQRCSSLMISLSVCNYHHWHWSTRTQCREERVHFYRILVWYL